LKLRENIQSSYELKSPGEKQASSLHIKSIGSMRKAGDKGFRWGISDDKA